MAPLEKGPVRGRTIPCATSKSLLEGEAISHAEKNDERKRDATVAALECGRSRFDPASGEGRLFASAEGGCRWDDPTFSDAMRVVFHARSGGGRDESASAPDREEEAARKSRIWSQHAANMSMPKSVYLRQEPEDLATIRHCGAWRSSASTGTDFAGEVARWFEPPLGASKDDRDHRRTAKTKGGLALAGTVDGDEGKISTKPDIDLVSFGIPESRIEDDYTLRLNSVPFTRFLDDCHAAAEDENVSRTMIASRLICFSWCYSYVAHNAIFSLRIATTTFTAGSV